MVGLDISIGIDLTGRLEATSTPPVPLNVRITEDGEYRITEDNNYRIIE
jgi:hypothetical protein